MALTDRAFNQTDGPFATSFVHSFMHAAGALGRTTHPETTTRSSLTRTPGQRFPHPPVVTTTTTREVPNAAGQHDLTWMKKDLYDAIIKNCTR